MSVVQPRNNDNFQIAAARMKRAAPNLFAEFEKALVNVVTDKISACVLSPGERVLNAQGQAQFGQELLKLLEDCITAADKIDHKLKERK